jgi:hypothetical protein
MDLRLEGIPLVFITLIFNYWLLVVASAPTVVLAAVVELWGGGGGEHVLLTVFVGSL